MRHARFFAIAITLVALMGGIAPTASADQPIGPPINGQVVLRIEPMASVDSILAEIDAIALDSIDLYDVFLAEFPDSVPVNIVVSALSQRPDVLFAEPNYETTLPEVNQISQGFPDQKAPEYEPDAQPASYFDQPALRTVRGDSAALVGAGTGTIVAVIDNGLDHNHPLFENRLVPGYDFVDLDSIPYDEPGLLNGHGTFVAGLVTLMADEAAIMPIRAFDGDGFGSSFSVSHAIHYAIDNGADVINMSFGQDSLTEVLSLALTEARNTGLTLVASVGNDSTDVATYPAASDGVIAVAAIDSLERITDFSNYGAHVDLVAPGTRLYSAMAGTSDWGEWSGTSFAAPLAAGAAALLLSEQPQLTGLEVEAHLRMAARTDLAWGTISVPSSEYGHGVADAFNALLAFNRGDVDGVVGIDIGDLTRIIDFLFLAGQTPQPTERAGDVTCDNTVDVGDLTELISLLFLGGSAPPICY